MLQLTEVTAAQCPAASAQCGNRKQRARLRCAERVPASSFNRAPNCTTIRRVPRDPRRDGTPPAASTERAPGVERTRRVARAPRIVRCVTILTALSACDAPPEPTAGPGLVLARPALSPDPRTVPLVEGCTPGDVLVRREDGYRCRAPTTTLYERRPASVAEAEAVTRAVTPLTAAAPRLPCGHRGSISHPEVELAASDCLPWMPPGATERLWWILGQTMKFRYSGGRPRTGSFRVTCPIEPRCGEWDGTWNLLTVYYLDPDGAGPEYDLEVTLYEGDQPLGSDCQGPSCTLRSSDQSTEESAEMFLRLGGFVPDRRRAARDPSYYRVEIEMTTTSNEGELQFSGLRIE